jgi:hypothetical protein
MEDLWDNFLSWKGAVKSSGYGIPTIRNTIDKLNALRAQGKLEFIECEPFEYKTARTGKVPGNLAYSKIKSGRDAKQIKIRLKEQG